MTSLSKFEALTYKISKKEMKTIFDGKRKVVVA